MLVFSRDLRERCVGGTDSAKHRPACFLDRLNKRSANRARGFTLIEMIIVISIVMILTSIAIPVYRMHILRAREAVLKEDLYSMRTSIDQYTQDKNKAPQALDDLVNTGYLHLIPKDPFTDSNTSWQVVNDDSITQLGQTDTGIVDVHSGSTLTASDGTAYNTW